MRFLGLNISRAPEQRAQGAGEYTNIARRAFSQAVRGEGGDIEDAAVAVIGQTMLSRAFMVATVKPALPAITPLYLSQVIKDLIYTGNHVAEIVIVDGQIELWQPSSYEIDGRMRPSSWRYRMEFPAPRLRTATRVQSFDGVIHVRLNPSKNRPWEGISPLLQAGLTTDILTTAEEKLGQVVNAHVANIVQGPSSALTSEQEATKVGNYIVAAKGKTMVQSGGISEGWRSRGSAGDWKQVPIGPHPDAQMIDLRSKVSRDILATMGIPASMYEGADRESFRQLLAAAVGPYASLIESELSQKLNRTIKFSFHRLGAADVAARARAFHVLVQGGVKPESAAEVADLGDVEFVDLDTDSGSGVESEDEE